MKSILVSIFSSINGTSRILTYSGPAAIVEHAILPAGYISITVKSLFVNGVDGVELVL